jgi:hypothetical protein
MCFAPPNRPSGKFGAIVVTCRDFRAGRIVRRRHSAAILRICESCVMRPDTKTGAYATAPYVQKSDS